MSFPDPSVTPLSRTGKPLASWEQYHNQFLHKPIRQGIDNDERDIGVYPRFEPSEDFNYRNRDYRKPWDDKLNRRNFGEPLPEDFDRLGTFMVDTPDHKLWFMLASVAVFLSFFPAFFYAVEWYKKAFNIKDEKEPFKGSRYKLKI